MGARSKKTESDLVLRVCPGPTCQGCEALRQTEMRSSNGVTSLRSLFGQIPSSGELTPPPNQHRICARLATNPNEPVPVGFAAAQESDSETAQIMYYVRSSEQGQNIGTILAQAILSLIKNLGFKKAHLDISPADTASISVAKKLGAEKVGATCYSGSDLQAWEARL